MRDVVERPVNGLRYATFPNIADRDHEVSGLDRVLMHRSAVGETGEADLGDVGAGKAVFEQGTNGIAIAQPLIEVAHVEMGIEGNEADLIEVAAQSLKRLDG